MKTCFLLAAFAAAMYGQLLPPGIGPAAGPAPGAAPQAAIGPDTVVATVAGISVTVADVRKILTNAPTQLTQQFQQNPQLALGQVYLIRYLAAEGEKLHLEEKSPLKEEIEELITLLKQQVLANAMVNQEQNGYLVSDEQIDDYYKKNQSRWEEAKIKVILVGFKPAAVAPAKLNAEASPTPGGAAPAVEDTLAAAAKAALEGAHPANERSQDEAQKLAASLVQQLRGGADFAKLVTQYSDDAESKSSGGDFGTPIRATSSFAPELKKIVMAMKPNEISDPVRQGNGFYIIRLESKTVQPLNDVRESIVKDLRDNHLHDYMNDLTNRFKPQVQRPDFFAQPGKFLSQPPK
jgi:peptidyl-prolyl cis-trans isomerase C